GLPVFKGAPKIGRRHSEIGRGSVEGTEEVRMCESTATEERQSTRFDPPLQLVALRYRDPAGGDRRVNTILERLLQRICQRARPDVETVGRVVDDGLAFVIGGRQLLRSDGSTAAGDCEPRRGRSRKFPPGVG